jgi:cytochrome c oxidase subunit 4
MSSTSATHHAHELPGPATYLKLAVILGIFTIIETSTYYIHVAQLIITLTLIICMTCKFVLVVGYYMHLKFESRVLVAVFSAGIMVALGGMLTMIALNHNF